jgi:hypothetical protein
MTRFIPIDKYVRDFLRASGKGIHGYHNAYNDAIRGLEQLQTDTLNNIKSAELQVNHTTQSVDWPNDYLNYTKIGVCIQGNVITLGLNDSICTVPRYDDCGDPIAVLGGDLKNSSGANSVESVSMQYPSWGYWFAGRAFGHGGGFNQYGYYKEDKQHRRFVFNSQFMHDSIILEYVASAYSEGVITMVDMFCHEALMAWMNYADMMYRKDVPASQKEYAHRMWVLEKKKAQLRTKSFTLDEFIQGTRMSYQAAPKT